jgi:hypothetical protein
MLSRMIFSKVENPLQEVNYGCILFTETIFSGRLCLPHTIDEESDEDEFVIEYVTDSDEDGDGDEEW